MIFASKAFLVFLPLVLLAYHLSSGRTRKYVVLLAASWTFYAMCSPRYLWVLILLTAVDYAVGRKIEAAAPHRKTRWLVVSIVANLGLLAAFKYTPFAYDAAAYFCDAVPPRAWEILLPLGISFHTFQGVSYTVDVYRGQIKAVRSLLDYAVFVAFFPQMAAGPIVRAAEFLPQMVAPPRVTADQIADGLHLFCVGLFKKLMVADYLDLLFVTPAFADPGAYTPGAQRWAAVAWAVQIYCDFSGYSDAACGLAKWFGFELPRNFNLPYLATSVPDFWRRWHLSLGTWLRDYLYFPLGGSRGSELRTAFNLMLLFVLCGLWHGATVAWVVYGVLFGGMMVLHRIFDRATLRFATLRRSLPYTLLAWATTMLILLIGLVIIRATTWGGCLQLLSSLAGVGTGGPKGVPAAVPLLVAIGLAGHAAELLRGRVRLAVPEGLRAAASGASVAAIVALGPGVTKTFIYIQF